MRSGVTVSVCLSVDSLIWQYRERAAHDRHEPLQGCEIFDFKQAIFLKRRRSRSSNWHFQGPRCSTQLINLRCEHACIYVSTRGLAPPCCSPPDPAYLWPPLASFTCLLPLAAQRNGKTTGIHQIGRVLFKAEGVLFVQLLHSLNYLIMKNFTVLACLAALVVVVASHTAEEWKSRVIYQVCCI